MGGADDSAELVDELRPPALPTVDVAVTVPLEMVDAVEAEPLAMAEADRFCDAERAPCSFVDESFVANLAGAGAPLSPRSLETGRKDFFSTGWETVRAAGRMGALAGRRGPGAERCDV